MSIETKIMRKLAVAVVGALALSAWVPGALLEGRQLGVAGDAPAVTPAEIQRMFDAYALVQAQDQLKLGDEQYSRFLPRFKTLQEIRRRTQAERVRTVQELRRLALDAKADESLLRDRIKALQELDVRTAADIRRAQDAVDQVLDVRQQAQFRGFEELMERRKIELVTRARQNNRPNGRGTRAQP
jgi:Spy/CpxP family protein refolding chaperone